MGKRITVADGYAVYVNGEQVTGGTTVPVDDTTADHWIARGWATEAKPTKATAKAIKPRSRKP